jgi:para-aminobenzoate synthetase/4-amino-4-deoxychorismate lyase
VIAAIGYRMIRPMHAPMVLLNDARRGPGHFLRFTSPAKIVCAWTCCEVGSALRAADEALKGGFHVAGWLSYEAGYALSTLALPSDAVGIGYPLVWFGVFKPPERLARSDLKAPGRAYAGRLRHEWDRDQYSDRCRCVQDYIRAGDIYQANLSFRSRFSFIGDALALYLDLWDAAQAPYAAYLDIGATQILSLSPELFFQVSKPRDITVRPMKGTAPRGESLQSDEEAARTLSLSEKNRAENVMIVDLMRSDLGRIAATGSVQVQELFELQTLPTLHTLVSSISAALKPSTSFPEIVEALFPSGSVTGAPKRRAMQIIRELESGPRAIYCGAVGHLTPEREASFNVAIRTLVIHEGEGTLGAGGAVVADSSPAAEYEECLLKTRWFESARKPIGLIETLRWEGIFPELERHLHRMAHSAQALALPFDRSAAVKALMEAVQGLISPQRVRLELSEAGTFVCTTASLEPLKRPWSFVLSPQRVNSRDPLLQHKTTWRELYENEWSRARALFSADEVLFLNERGELTEGSRTNLFIRRAQQLLTPAISCGLLDGVLRRRLLETGQCQEAVLRPEDLREAEEVLLGNALRGLIGAFELP